MLNFNHMLTLLLHNITSLSFSNLAKFINATRGHYIRIIKKNIYKAVQKFLAGLKNSCKLGMFLERKVLVVSLLINQNVECEQRRSMYDL